MASPHSIDRHYIKHETEILTLNLGIPNSYKEECLKETYRLGDSMNSSTNVKAIMTTYEVWNETKVFNPLIQRIYNKVCELIPSHDDKLFRYHLLNAWVATYKQNHFTIPHVHTPSTISFIYYLKAPKSSSVIKFDSCNYSIEPIDDLLIIFPSYLVHSVPSHSINEDRICLAGNIHEDIPERYSQIFI